MAERGHGGYKGHFVKKLGLKFEPDCLDQWLLTFPLAFPAVTMVLPASIEGHGSFSEHSAAVNPQPGSRAPEVGLGRQSGEGRFPSTSQA